MTTDTPQTPDVDLPGQPHDEADLDMLVREFRSAVGA